MMLLGYGSYFGYSFYYITSVMLFVFVPFMFLSACLAVLILMAIMKLAGRIGFRKVMAGLFIIYLSFIYLFFDSSNPMRLVEKLNRFIPDMDAYIVQSTPEFLRYLPNQWVAEFLYYSARGEIINALPYAGILFLITAIAFCLCLFVAYRFYYRSWLVSLQVKSTAQTSTKPARKYFFDFQSPSIFSSQVEVILKKEILAFFRESSQWIHLAVMIILTGLFSISIGSLNLRSHLLDMQLIIYLVIFAFSGFMVGSLALRFVFPMIGLEGQTFWALRTSPIKESKIIMLKFLLSFFIIFLLAEYISISSAIPFVKKSTSSLLLWIGMFSGFWISVTTVSLNLGLGGYFANYFEHNPIRAASTQGATLTFLVTIIYLVMLVAIIFVPISVYFTSVIRFQYFPVNLLVLPCILFAAISCFFSVSSFIIGLKSVRRDF
jgi:ABC-2 type transport system permease protein